MNDSNSVQLEMEKILKKLEKFESRVNSADNKLSKANTDIQNWSKYANVKGSKEGKYHTLIEAYNRDIAKLMKSVDDVVQKISNLNSEREGKCSELSKLKLRENNLVNGKKRLENEKSRLENEKI